jgi:hypothetical protein
MTLGQDSLAIDAALLLPNINDGYLGNAPDLGAIEHGEPMPAYGVRHEYPNVKMSFFGNRKPRQTL